MRFKVVDLNSSIKEVLEIIEKHEGKVTLYVIDEGKLYGTVTEGDIRRGIIKFHISANDKVSKVTNRSPKKIYISKIDYKELINLRKEKYTSIPIVNESEELIRVLDLDINKNILPIDAIIMAGGKGVRLKPLTDNCPKPLLEVGNKPIIEYGIERMIYDGISKIHISINYLKEQLVDYSRRLELEKGIPINCIEEKEFSGTIASARDAVINQPYCLVQNSDLIADIDYENLLLELEERNLDLIVVGIKYSHIVPFAVFDISPNLTINSLVEKPEKIFWSNGGIYLFKTELLDLIPENSFYNATDFIENLLKSGHKVGMFEFHGQWIDIGRHSDFEYAKSLYEK